MELKLLHETFTVCKLHDLSDIDLTQQFVFLSVTDEEFSLVCPSHAVPLNIIVREDGWSALKITGVLDFSLVGILAKITSILAENQISVFAISTFNTDYILIKTDYIEQGIQALTNAHYHIAS